MVNTDILNLVSCLLIVFLFWLHYILVFKVNNYITYKKGARLEFSEALIRYRTGGIASIIIALAYVFSFIAIYIHIYNDHFDRFDIFDIGFNNIVLVSSTLIMSFVAINYSLNDSDYFIITNKDTIIQKNIGKNILYLFSFYFTLLIIILLHALFPKVISKYNILVLTIYILSLVSLIICEIVILIKTYNIYYSSKHDRLRLLNNLYYYRFADLSNNEYCLKYKNYTDGVYYLASQLYKSLIKSKITNIDII